MLVFISCRCLGRVVGRLEASRRGEEGRTAEAASYLLGGSFNRLELDWKDSHSAYLSHRAARCRGQLTRLWRNILWHHILISRLQKYQKLSKRQLLKTASGGSLNMK